MPGTLAPEALCIEHYIDEAFVRLRRALEFCQHASPVDSRLLDWLLADADFAVHSLSQNAHQYSASQRARLLELLLALANLHEYLRHHSVELARAD